MPKEHSTRARTAACVLGVLMATQGGGTQGNGTSNPSEPFAFQGDRSREQAANEPVPGECLANASSDTGQPLMFPRGPLSWGLSTKPIVYGQKLLVLLWIYNPTETPQSVMTCSDIDHFWAREIGIFSSADQRLSSRAAEKLRKENYTGPTPIFICARNFGINLPPHACLHGTFSQPEWDFARDLNDYYELPTGSYFLVPMTGREAQSLPQGTRERMPKLSITIQKP